MNRLLPVAGPSITQREIDAVTSAVTNGWYDDAELFQRRFEAAFAAHTGRRHAIALPSCTSALHLALAGLGVGPGDEVIVPELTWIASAAPIVYLGATPVLADVEPDTWCISAASFEASITDRTRAVVVVDLFGNMPDMDAIGRIAQARGVAVLEDAAQAIGSEHRGRRAGSFGAASAFSFHGSKTLTTGEGGMLVTDDDTLHRRALRLRDHGREPGSRGFYNLEIGFKYRMSAMQAALGLAQLERLTELVEKKRAIFSWYERRLAGVPGVTLNTPGEHVRSSYWMSSVLLDPALGLEKAELIRRLAEAGVDSRPFFHALSSLPAFEGRPGVAAARERNRVAHAIAGWGVSLPSALTLEEADIAAVCDALITLLARRREAAPAASGAG